MASWTYDSFAEKVGRALDNCGGCGDGVNWNDAAQQAERELPQADVETKEARAWQLLAEAGQEAAAAETSIYMQGPQGNKVTDFKEAGRRMMLRAGQNPDKALDIQWHRVPDLRDNRDPEAVGKAYLARSNGNPS